MHILRPLAACAAALALVSPLTAMAGGFVDLPSSGADIRVQGSNNLVTDPLYLATNPFASGYTLLASLSQPLLFDLDGNGSQDWVGTFSDRVYRNDSTGKLSFALRLEDTRTVLSPLNGETEINLIWRSGFSGYSTAVAWYAEGLGGTDPDGSFYNGDFRLQAAARVADGFVFRAGTQPDRLVPASAYSQTTVGFRTDTSVPEGNPNSGWYLVQTNASSFTVMTEVNHIRQSAGTGPEARPQRDWLLAGFAPVAAPVPEVHTPALLLAGLGVLALLRHRRNRH